MEAKKKHRRLFTTRSGKKVNLLAAEIYSGRYVLKISEGKVYGSEAQELIDSRSMPKTIFKSLADRLSVIEENTNKRTTVANGSSQPFWAF